MEKGKCEKLMACIKKNLIAFTALIIIMSLSSCGQATYNQLLSINGSSFSEPIVDNTTQNIDPPKKNPEVQIIAPLNNSHHKPGDMVIGIKVDNFSISQKEMGAVNCEGQGHLIYYLDETPPVNLGESAMTSTSIVSTNRYHLWKDVGEGEHTLSVQLVNDDNTPLKVPVVASITVESKE